MTPFKHFFLIYLHAVINLYDHLSGLSERSFGAPNLEKKTVKYARLFICLLIYIRVPFIYSISLVSPVGLRGGGGHWVYDRSTTFVFLVYKFIIHLFLALSSVNEGQSKITAAGLYVCM